MGLWSPLQWFSRSKLSAALDRFEDPRETLEYRNAQQQELLRKVRQGLIEVATSKRHLELQTQRIRERIAHFEEQARCSRRHRWRRHNADDACCRSGHIGLKVSPSSMMPPPSPRMGQPLAIAIAASILSALMML